MVGATNPSVELAQSTYCQKHDGGLSGYRQKLALSDHAPLASQDGNPPTIIERNFLDDMGPTCPCAPSAMREWLRLL